MPDLPSSLALTTISDGSEIIASTHRNNNTAVQTAVNAIRDCLASGVAGQKLRATDSDTVAWSYEGFTYRKTTEKDVANSAAETDLLNGEITIGAGVMGTTGRLRVTLFGDYLNNTGGNQQETLRIKLGGTTIWDSGVSGNRSTSANRRAWRMQFDIQNLGAANSQFSQGSIMGFQSGTAPTTGIGATTDATALYAFASNGTTAIDTSASCALVVSVQLSAASANLSFRLKSALVEVL